MKTKFFAPLLLLIAGVFFVTACSKQESTPGIDKQSQTNPRRGVSDDARNNVSDDCDGLEDLLDKGKWSIIKTDELNSKPPYEVLHTYKDGEYLLVFETGDTGYLIGEPTQYEKLPIVYEADFNMCKLYIWDRSTGIIIFDAFVDYTAGRHLDRNLITMTGMTGMHFGEILTTWYLKHTDDASVKKATRQ